MGKPAGFWTSLCLDLRQRRRGIPSRACHHDPKEVAAVAAGGCSTGLRGKPIEDETKITGVAPENAVESEAQSCHRQGMADCWHGNVEEFVLNIYIMK